MRRARQLKRAVLAAKNGDVGIASRIPALGASTARKGASMNRHLWIRLGALLIVGLACSSSGPQTDASADARHGDGGSAGGDTAGKGGHAGQGFGGQIGSGGNGGSGGVTGTGGSVGTGGQGGIAGGAGAAGSAGRSGNGGFGGGAGARAAGGGGGSASGGIGGSLGTGGIGGGAAVGGSCSNCAPSSGMSLQTCTGTVSVGATCSAAEACCSDNQEWRCGNCVADTCTWGLYCP